MIQHIQACINKSGGYGKLLDLYQNIDQQLHTQAQQFEIKLEEQQSEMEEKLRVKDQRITELEQQLADHNAKLWELAGKPRINKTSNVVNNNNNQRLILNLNDGEKMQPEDLVHGQISLAQFMVDNYLTEDGKRCPSDLSI